MIVDKNYCMSSFLMYRTVADDNKCFKEGIKPNLYQDIHAKKGVRTSRELGQALKKCIESTLKKGKTALALSGGIDSAVLAKYMHGRGKAYTFQCIVPGIEVTNEVPRARKYAEACDLEQEVVEVYWSDMEEYTPILMKHKGAPIHSIEVQIYKAALRAKQDGFENIIFGESADLNYGGLSGLMSKDWRLGEFVDRYSYVLPYKVLKEPELILEPISRYEREGYIDAFEFCRGFFFREAMGSYTNACECAGINLVCPYAYTKLDGNLDYDRIRSGENKYLIRELFGKLYSGFEQPTKLPMPRPSNEWYKDWKGPIRQEFWEHCAEGLTGDQKWLLWSLEKFLDVIESR